MIPKKLFLQNYQSYGQEFQELDFDLFRIACLTGPNGAGKSSLIEAMVWCVWGEGRSKSSGLIRDGATEMRVEFEFELEHGRYKIIRIASRNKKGSVSEQVEFQIYDPSENRYRALTESRLRDTDRVILATVGIDYETFVSSAFVVQGDSDKFTSKSPKQQKETLSQILGINRYQRLSDFAKEKAKLLSEKIQRAEGRLEEIETDLQRIDDIREKLAAAQEERKQHDQKLTSEKEAFAKIDKELKALDQIEFQQNQLTAQLQTLGRELDEYEEKKARKLAEKNRLHEIVSRKSEVEQRKNEYDALRQTLTDLDKKATQAEELQQKFSTLQNQREKKRFEHKSKITNAENSVRQLEGRIGIVREKLSKINIQLSSKTVVLQKKARLTEITSKLEQLAGEKQRLIEKISGLKTAIDHHNRQLNTITEKGKTINSLTDSCCPLCRSPLDAEHRDHIVQEYRQEYTRIQEEKNRLAGELHAGENSLAELDRMERGLQAEQKGLASVEKELAAIEHQASLLEETEQELNKTENEKTVAETELNVLKRQLSSGAVAAEENRLCAEIEGRIQALGYDAGSHRAARLRAGDLASVEREVAELQYAGQKQTEIEDELSGIEKKTLEASEKSVALESEVNTLQTALEGKGALTARHKEEESSLRETERLLQDKRVQEQHLQQQARELGEKARTKKEIEESLKSEREQKEIYEVLQEAFGIKGIQSILIENAVPELQREANILLQKLTANQMSVMIRTQKEKITSGELEDTLAIEISDVRGQVRDYSTFSGGEKFRVDLALRIALSKLLAVQSGVSVKMLVIDEGFGTQDEEGLEAIIDSIARISDEFEKIILITHLDKLRDAFEVKISVTKDPYHGSRFEISNGSV